MMIRMRPHIPIFALTIGQDQRSWNDVALNNVKKSHFPSIRNRNNEEFRSPAAALANNPLRWNKSSPVIFSFGDDRFINFNSLIRPTNRIYCNVSFEEIF